MQFMTRPALALASAMVVAASAPMMAQTPKPAAEASTASTPRTTLPPDAPTGVTGKERLGNKWLDEQRTDNCNVPIDKRGTKPRPDTCPDSPTR